MAQDTAAAAATDQQEEDSRLDDIIVVSRKRATGESLQDTPVAATAFGAQQLEEAGVKDLTDVGRMAPSVSLQPSSQRGVQNFSIRGMGVSGSTPSDEPAVGIFQDGIYWGSNYGALNELFDIEGVEILRGPQGTLFGRNVTGGAVTVRSGRPSFATSAEGTAGIGNYGLKEVSGVVTGPLIGDKLAGRLALQSRSLDGYFTNTVTGRDYGRSDSYIVRPSLTWQPTTTFSITALAEWFSDSGDPTVVRGIAPCTIPGCAPNLATREGFTTSDDYYDVAYNEPGSNEVDVFLGVVEANWDVLGGVLTSVTGVRNVRTRVLTDFDGTPSAGFLQQIAQDQEQFSTELRFAADVSSFLSYTVGLYYFDQNFDFRERRSLNNNATNIATRSYLDNDSFAAFADADFNITDSLTVTAGVRYTTETKTASAAAFGACSLDFLTCTLTGPRTTSDENVSPRISVSYDLDDNQLMYASATRGFRSGGFSLRGTPLVEPYQPEEVTAYEIGYKGDLLDRRLRLNLAAYHNTYDNLQRTVLGVSPTAGVVQSVFNAAAATVSGVEAEATAIITNNFEVTAAYGFTDARYDEFLGVVDPGSRSFVRIPENTGTIAARYERDLEGGGQIVARAAAQYTGEYFYDDTNLLKQEAYTLVDASLAYTAPSEIWTVTLWGKNLTEEEYAPWGSTLGGLGENRFPAAPRTFGIRIQARY
ncbi:MAG: TonB-dependent receptor [Brevundimonas sp.]|uniref:TonB-dependent receptor n=1 Tax=Brevundimonas sp. TaxID=1871086 RepID=UPI00248862B4|nr:TonB-dependent receptor [Brevundimonas sp.]MDI1327591.1 TonB-dependent receptor [Brevundimonas sp.]